MAKQREKKPLKNQNGNFTITGEVKLNEYSFDIEAESSNSDWISNKLQLKLDVGNGNAVTSILWGGYGSDRENFITVFGKKQDENGKVKDDFTNMFKVAWKNRLDEEVLDEVAEFKFIKVGLEKDSKGKTIVKKFISGYDAVLYAQEHLEDGMVVTVKGELKHELYDGNVNIKKNITGLFISKFNEPFGLIEDYTTEIAEIDADETLTDEQKEKKIEVLEKYIEEQKALTVENRKKYRAKFEQGILVDNASAGKFDKERSAYPIDARILAYTKMYNDIEVKTTVPMNVMYEFEIRKGTQDEDVFNYMFGKLKKGIREIVVEGDLMEGGATKVEITWDDVQDDIKALVAIGAYTKEEALAMGAVKGSTERRMLIRRPVIKKKRNDDTITMIPQVFEDVYKEEDLFLDCMIEAEEEVVKDVETVENDDVPFDMEDDEETDENAWLKDLE